MCNSIEQIYDVSEERGFK